MCTRVYFNINERHGNAKSTPLQFILDPKGIILLYLSLILMSSTYLDKCIKIGSVLGAGKVTSEKCVKLRDCIVGPG